ncbi:unnamed protein product, partial [Vitrella brassicaformis CCMP3155]
MASPHRLQPLSDDEEDFEDVHFLPRPVHHNRHQRSPSLPPPALPKLNLKEVHEERDRNYPPDQVAAAAAATPGLDAAGKGGSSSASSASDGDGEWCRDMAAVAAPTTHKRQDTDRQESDDDDFDADDRLMGESAARYMGKYDDVKNRYEGLLPGRALKGRPSTLSPSEREPLTVSTAGSPSPRKGVRLSLGRSGSDIGAGTSEVVSSSSQHGGAFPFVDSSGHSDLDAMRRAITTGVPSRQGSGASHGGLSQSFTSSQGESAASRRESAASASGAANEELAQLLSENEQFRQQVLVSMDRSPGQRLDASGRSSQQRRKSAFATTDSGLLSMGSLDEISESYERQMESMESDESDKACQEEKPRGRYSQQRRKSAFATMDSGLLSMGRLLLLTESIDKARQEEEPREKGPSSRRGSLITSSRQRMSVGEQQFIEELQEEVDRLQKQLRNANEDLRRLSNTMDTEEYKKLQERYEEKEAELATVKRQVNEHKRGEENAKRKNTELQQV